MSTIKYVEPTSKHLKSIADRMRLSDKLEVAASRGHTPLEALEAAVEESTTAFVALINGIPEGAFGFVMEGGFSAQVWMLGTEGLTADRELFFRETSEILDEASNLVCVLHNFVDDENEVSKRWLQRAGFTLAEPKPYGVSGLPFRYFYRLSGGHRV